MKTMLLVSGKACWGKTSLATTLAASIPLAETEYFDYEGNRLNEQPDDSWVLCRGRYEKDGSPKSVGISSEGDSAEIVEKGIKVLTDNFGKETNILIITCRPRGGSIKKAVALAKQYGYEAVVLSNYHGVDLSSNEDYYAMSGTKSLSNGLDLNEACAKSIEELIKRL